MDLLHGGSGSSANAITRGGHRGFNHGGGGRGRGRGNNSHDGRPGHNSYNTDRPTCELCDKEGHTVLRCYKRFDASFTRPPEHRSTLTATTSYGVDTNWYTKTDATDHITGELEKLTVWDKYHDKDQVHTTNGACMRINQIGQSFICTPK
jgi:hypothetical protein